MNEMNENKIRGGNIPLFIYTMEREKEREREIENTNHISTRILFFFNIKNK